MSRSILVLLVVVAVGAVLAFVLLGQGPGDGSSDPLDRGASEDELGDLGATGDAATRGAAGGEDAPVVLFGRPREKRPGKGAVTGIVADARTGGPVAEAELLLSGKAHDGKDVRVRVRSAADGRFTHGDLAAGEGYVLKVVSQALPERTLGGIEVEDGQVTKLGKIWLGESASITGRVLDGEGRGVGSASVKLFPAMGSWLDLMGDMIGLLDRLDQEPKPVLETVTHADGRFEMEGVDPGTWTVIARASGYGQAVHEVSVAATAPPDLELRLAQADVLRGVVVDGRERPVANARVAAMANQNPFGFIYGRRFATTGADGRFEVDVVTGSQPVMLMAAAEGYPTHMAPVLKGVLETTIVLDKGCRLTVELLAMPDDQPVEGASIMVAVSDASTLGQQGASAMAHGRTGADGRATLDVATGKIQIVWITHPVSGGGMWMPQMPQLPFGLKGPKDPALEGGERTITLRIPVRKTIVGMVTGPKGEPVVGATVTSPLSMQMGGTPVITDASGRYRYHAPEFPGGALVLSAQAPGYVQDPASLSANGKEPDANGEITHDITMKLAAVIQGRVLGPTRKPLAGVRVKHNLNLQAAMMGGLLGGSGETLTGEDGTYLLENIQPGSGTSVVARLDGFLDTASGTFDVKAGEISEAPDLVLHKGAAVVVFVQDPDGRALSSARIEYSFERKDDVTWDFMEVFTGSRTLAADASGRATVKNVPAGTATFTVSHDDHASAKASVDVEDGDEEKTLTIRAQRGRRIEGRVLDPDGAPIGGAFVSVRVAPSRAPAGSTHTSKDGRFAVERVPEGDAEIQVSVEGFVRRTVTADGAREVRLERVDQGVQEQLAEISALIREKQQAMLEADNAAERQALQQEIAQLSQELNRLQAEQQE